MSHITGYIVATSIVIAALGCRHAARTPPAPPPAPVPAAVQEQAEPAVPRQSIAKLALGDAVVAAYARGDDRVEVGASAPGGSILLQFTPSDVVQWAATATQILKSPVRASRGSSNVDRATLTEPGVTAGAITLNRRVSGRKATYGLFFANRNFGGFPVQLTKRDAQVLVSTLRNAAAVATRMTHAANESTAAQRDTTAIQRRP